MWKTCYENNEMVIRMKNLSYFGSLFICIFIVASFSNSQQNIQFEIEKTPINITFENTNPFDIYHIHRFADFNNDGLVDVLSTAPSLTDIYLYYRLTDGLFTEPSVIYNDPSRLGGRIFDIKTTDLNNDGFLDIVAIRENENPIILLNQSNRTWETLYLDEMNIHSLTNLIFILGDYDNDGIIDIVGKWRDKFVIILGKGDCTFQNGIWINDNNVIWVKSIRLIDFNHDGLLDVITDLNSLRIAVYINDGNLGFLSPIIFPIDEYDFNNSGRFFLPKDFNLDGFADLIRYNPGQIAILQNKGDNSFQETYVRNENNQPGQISVLSTDFNLDGADDLLVYTWLSHRFYFNTSSIMYGSNQSPFSTRQDLYVAQDRIVLSIDLEDANQDEWVDISLIETSKDFTQTEYIQLVNQGIKNQPIRIEPDTLLVPEEFPSIQQAVRESIEGDVISVAPGEYYEHIWIEDKNLTIVGRDEYNFPIIKTADNQTTRMSETSVLNIRNSDVRLVNLVFISLFSPKTVIVYDSNVKLYNCILNGSNTYNFDGYIVHYSKPALEIKNCNNKIIQIDSTTLNSGKKSENEMFIGAAIKIDSCTDTELYFSNSNVYGGTAELVDTRFGSLSFSGGSALHVLNTINLQLFNQVSTFYGGKGSGSTFINNREPTSMTNQAKEGGTSCVIDNSSVYIKNGTFVGGAGGDGFEYFSDYLNDWVIGKHGLGGCGIQIINHSYVEIENGTIKGGKTGLTSEMETEAVCLDDTSSYHFVTTSSVNNWSLY